MSVSLPLEGRGLLLQMLHLAWIDHLAAVQFLVDPLELLLKPQLLQFEIPLLGEERTRFAPDLLLNFLESLQLRHQLLARIECRRTCSHVHKRPVNLGQLP
jgi:hypothetical protein